MQAEAPEVFDLAKEPVHVHSRHAGGHSACRCVMGSCLTEARVVSCRCTTGRDSPRTPFDEVMTQKDLAEGSDDLIATFIEEPKLRGMGPLPGG